jgi:hypothetical protein
MLGILGEKIHDGRFLRLLRNMLTAGYLEDWRWGATMSGAPQGGVASPVLSNIYLDRLDGYVETVLLPEYNRGGHRRRNPAYQNLAYAIGRARARGDAGTARRLRQERRLLPSVDTKDPGYRRLRYIRYADDFLLGFSGPRTGAEQIRCQIRDFLREDLRLELSQDKTLITHARTGAAKFLGYQITTQHANDKLDHLRKRSVNGVIGLQAPRDVITARCALYCRGGKPAPRPQMLHDTDYSIVMKYQAEYRGVVAYYLLAENISAFRRLLWVMQTSLLRTLAAKHHSTVAMMARKYKAEVSTQHGPRRCYQVTVQRGKGQRPLAARFGGIPLRRQQAAVLADSSPVLATTRGNELIARLLAGCCEACGAAANLEVHHIRHLADLRKPGRRGKPAWVRLMAMRQRKTLVVCHRCHRSIHTGQPAATTPE